MKLTRTCVANVVAVIAIIAVCIVTLVGLTAMGGSTDPQVQRLGAISTGTAAFVGLIGVIVLIFYTKETYLLRTTAEQQLEASEKPVVLFEISSTEFQFGKLELTQPTIRNVGSGPAFNLVIEPAKGNGVEVEWLLPNVPYVAAKQQLPLEPLIRWAGQANGMSSWLVRLAELFPSGKLPDGTLVVVLFDSLSGKRYRSKNRIRYEPSTKRVGTSLVPPIEEV